MASPLVSRTPNCISCLRRMSLCGDMISPPTRIQTRGKKFVAKAPSSVKVQLLQSIPGYGKKGSVVPITPGVMRNIWYPRKMATYVTMSKLQELGGKDIAAERDPLYGSNKQRKAAERERREAKAAAGLPVGETATDVVEDPNSDTLTIEETNIGLDTSTMAEPSASLFAAHENSSDTSDTLEKSPSPSVEPPQAVAMTPELATGTLSRLLPESIDFFRIPTAVKPLKAVSSSLSSGAVRSAAARAQAAKTTAQEKTQKIEINGSVTKSDIGATLKAILAEDENGRQIALSAENITLRDETADNEGIKHLGTFEVNIRVDGSAEVVKRVLRVVAQGES